MSKAEVRQLLEIQELLAIQIEELTARNAELAARLGEPPAELPPVGEPDEFSDLMPTRKAVGLLKVVSRPRVDRDGDPVIGPNGKQVFDDVTMVTPAGQKFFAKFFADWKARKRMNS
jgi:hypothetical protein